ncbi:MAG: RluA family pseudouridine synthase [Planctomycetia bacterium]|nr:RluA family pseudouridine synthase [Planctomycetia bacterium]
MQVLFEDNHLLVVQKPAGLPTMGVAAGEKSLLTVAKEYIAKKYQKPGNVYLGVVSRLDTPTTGVVVIARTSKAADRLNVQFREHNVRKVYYAVVSGRLCPEEGSFIDRIAEEKRHRKMFITKNPSLNAVTGILHYRTVKYNNSFQQSLLEILLETGRKHQIRVQMSYHGHPIVGDRKYGSSVSFPVGIALHAKELTIRHPISQELMTFVAPFPRTWKEWES